MLRSIATPEAELHAAFNICGPRRTLICINGSAGDAGQPCQPGSAQIESNQEVRRMTLLRLATFNLENLDDAPSARPLFEQRLMVLRPALEGLAADILCLQEVSARRRAGAKKGGRTLEALDALLRGTPYADYARTVSLHRDGHGPLDVQNLAILSRFPFVSARQYWHDLLASPIHVAATAVPFEPAPWHIEWDRPVLHGTIALPGGRRIEVLNLHLRAPIASFIPGQKLDAARWRTTAGWAEGFYLAAVKRAGQALEARRAVDRIFAENPESWIAVCGDMNAEVSEMPLRILRSAVEDTGNPALAGAALTVLEAAVAGGDRYSVIHAGRRLMLDHILVSTPLAARLQGVEIGNRDLVDEATSEPPAGSFHAPMVATFEV
jgi:endonuclease/exonuclease/phosphatase family metal-dependent hydrolase